MKYGSKKGSGKGYFGNSKSGNACNVKKADTIRKLKNSLRAAEKRGNVSLAKSKRAVLTMLTK